MRVIPLLTLLAASVAAACASPPLDPSGGPPADFLLEVRSRGATNPHCDYEVTVDSSGRVVYAIDHHGQRVGDRRGEERIDPAALHELWAAVASSGIFALPATLPPQDGQDERGEVRYVVHAGGRHAEILADRAGTPGLDAVLRAVHRAVPWRAWQIPGEGP